MKPKIYVFCNNKSCDGRGDWHSMLAVSEEGAVLAGHVCSSHGFAVHDMGIQEGGWKREIYAHYFPGGFEVIGVDDPSTHAGLIAALAKGQAAGAAK